MPAVGRPWPSDDDDDDDDDHGGDYLAAKHGETAELVKSSSVG